MIEIEIFYYIIPPSLAQNLPIFNIELICLVDKFYTQLKQTLIFNTKHAKNYNPLHVSTKLWYIKIGFLCHRKNAFFEIHEINQ